MERKGKRNIFTKLFFAATWSVLLLGGLFFSANLDRILTPKGKTLHVFAWGDFLHQDSVTQFEKETGIHVKVHNYSSNEELLVKLKATRGEGYDLIVPSDYAVKILIDEQLLQKLDHNRLDMWDQVEPFLLGQEADPTNSYSIPHSWEVYGVGVDPDFYAKHPLKPYLKDLFGSEKLPYSISMTPDPVEALAITSYLAFGPQENQLSNEQAQVAKQMLAAQKKNVEAYADYRAKYLIQTHNCPVALMRSSFVWQMARDDMHVNFLLPEDGLFVSIENVCIPKGTQKIDEVYQFINFLYRPEQMAKQMESCPTFPALTASIDFIEEGPQYLDVRRRALEKGNFLYFRYPIPEQEIREMWVDIKSIP